MMTITTDTDRDRAKRLDAALRGTAGDSPPDLRGPTKATAPVGGRATVPYDAVSYDDDDLFENVPI